MKRINDVTYVVKADKWRGSKVTHVEKMKPIYSFS